jgi:hypothetical protein
MAEKERFFGAWATPAARRLKALAALRGVSQSELLRGLVEDAAARALGSLEEDPGEPSAATMHNRAGHVLADPSAVVA